MPLTTIMGLALPLIQKLVSWVLDRVFKNGSSTAQGMVAGGGVLAMLQAFGCDMTLMQQGLVAGVSTLPGALTNDATKVSQTFFQAIQEVVDQAKRSAQVLADAEAAQKAALEKK